MSVQPTPRPIEIHLSDTARLVLVDPFMIEQETRILFDFCLNNIFWEQSTISLFGKSVLIPRLNAWYGDHPYSYSGTTFSATPWPAELLDLKNRIENEFGLKLNSALANLYRDGNDGMGWHSDDEKTLGFAPQIASVSLGGSRRFLLRNKSDKTQKHELLLTDGSIVLMLGTCQRDWQHCVPKTRKSVKPRINLTFRYVQP